MSVNTTDFKNVFFYSLFCLCFLSLFFTIYSLEAFLKSVVIIWWLITIKKQVTGTSEFVGFTTGWGWPAKTSLISPSKVRMYKFFTGEDSFNLLPEGSEAKFPAY